MLPQKQTQRQGFEYKYFVWEMISVVIGRRIEK